MLKEYQKDVTLVADVKFTRVNRKVSTTEQHNLAITDHVAQENHTIKWDEAKLLDRDSNTFTLTKNSGGHRPFSYCIDQAGLGAFTAKSGRKHYNPPPLTVM